jgi:AraC-like DNA-binding protein
MSYPGGMLAAMFRERTSWLPGAVVWTREVPAGAPPTQRILPDGCLDLIWTDGTLLVAGPDSAARLTPTRPGARYVGLRFAPGTGPAVLGVPGHVVCDEQVRLDQLWPAARVRALTDRLVASARPGEVLEQAAAEPLRGADPMAPSIVARLRTGATVAATADAVGLSERQLHRRCLDAFGYGPKRLARVLRMERAVELARAGKPFAEVAFDAGYADQAHLTREVKALAGVSLTVLTR